MSTEVARLAWSIAAAIISPADSAMPTFLRRRRREVLFPALRLDGKFFSGRASNQLFEFERGRRMHWKTQSSTTLPPDTSTPGLALDSESQFADEVTLLNLAREEKGSFDHFQTLLSTSNEELATLLARQRQIKTLVECVLPIIDKHLAGGT